MHGTTRARVAATRRAACFEMAVLQPYGMAAACSDTCTSYKK